MRSRRPQTTPIGQTTGDRLAVHDHVGLDAEELLRAAGREAEAGIHLIEDQRHIGRRARQTELLEPRP